jgi:hypothetical protein
MSTLSATGIPTLVNVVKTMRPDGSPEMDIANILSEKMSILDDIPWVEGNLPTGHRITSVNGLPSPTWRRLNEGIDPTYGTTTQYDEACGILEQHVKVDVDVANFNGNAAAYRMLQNKLAIEGFRQELSRAIFYESTLANPEKIHGLSARYPATTGYTASDYVLKPGTNSGSNCRSVWLINWSVGKLYGIYPKGSVAGLSHEDLGRDLVTLNSKDLLMYRDRYQWQCGLAVQDFRHACRFQWDPDDTTNFADTAKIFYISVGNMINTVYDMDNETARLYMDRTSYAKLYNQLASNTTNYLEYIELGKRRVPAFLGVVVRIDDKLTAETAIS